MSVLLTEIRGIGPAAAALLKQHGLNSVKAVAAVSLEKLAQVPGFGELRAAAVIQAAAELVGEPKDNALETSEAKVSKVNKDKKKKKKKKNHKDKKSSDSKKDSKKDKKKKNKKSKKKK